MFYNNIQGFGFFFFKFKISDVFEICDSGNDLKFFHLKIYQNKFFFIF